MIPSPTQQQYPVVRLEPITTAGRTEIPRELQLKFTVKVRVCVYDATLAPGCVGVHHTLCQSHQIGNMSFTDECANSILAAHSVIVVATSRGLAEQHATTQSTVFL